MRKKYSHLTIEINDDGLKYKEMQNKVCYLRPNVAYISLPDLEQYSKLLWHDSSGNEQVLNLHNIKSLPLVAIFHCIITQDPTFIRSYKGNSLAKFMVQFLAVKDFVALEVCLGKKLTTEDQTAIIDAEKIFITALDEYSAAALYRAVDALNGLEFFGSELQNSLMSQALRKSKLLLAVNELNAWQVKDILDVIDGALEVEPKFAIIKIFFLQVASARLAKYMSFGDLTEVLCGDKPILELLNPASLTLLRHAPVKFSLDMLRRLDEEGVRPTVIEQLFTVLLTKNLTDSKKAIEVLHVMPPNLSSKAQLDLIQIAAFADEGGMADICRKIITHLAGSHNSYVSSFCTVVGRLFGQDDYKPVVKKLLGVTEYFKEAYNESNAAKFAESISPADLMEAYLNQGEFNYAYAIMKTLPKKHLALKIDQALLPLYSNYLELAVYGYNGRFDGTKKFKLQKQLIKSSKTIIAKMLERLDGEIEDEQINLLQKYAVAFHKLFDDTQFARLILNFCYDQHKSSLSVDKIKVDATDIDLQIMGDVSSAEMLNMAED